ncbi:MAG TPA: ATP-binding protein [Solirubrobacteraceae bacterium]|nr:ATP-binding protein [Solirubrobacteraceae bacterium]
MLDKATQHVGAPPPPVSVVDVRARERRRLRAKVRATIVPGLERLDDPSADPAVLIARADVEAAALRAALEDGDASADVPSIDAIARRAREDEREWVRGHLHDTALQILEFIAGDGFGTGLSAQKISHLAGGAARDLRRWSEGFEEPAGLLPELEQIAAEATALHSTVRLVVGELGGAPTSEQIEALAGAVREAVTNARKHARASQVIVRVECSDDGHTAVTVADDGVGFDWQHVADARGLGLRTSIVGRMQRVGGHASLEQAPGGGTLVTLMTSSQRSAP